MYLRERARATARLAATWVIFLARLHRNFTVRRSWVRWASVDLRFECMQQRHCGSWAAPPHPTSAIHCAVMGLISSGESIKTLLLSPRIPAQAEPAILGLKGWPLTVASSFTGAGWRRAAIVKQVASAIVMSWARRSSGSELSSDSSVAIESHLVCASPARTEPARAYRAVTVMRTFFGSMCRARATCTSCVASQNPTATVK